MSLTIQLPVRPDHVDFNLMRWEEVLVDPHYTNLDGTFETTTDGVKGVDVVWLTEIQMKETGEQTCVPFAPAICIEIKSPRNSWPELNEKKALYFAAGASEGWICDEDSKMLFFVDEADEEAVELSIACPEFPVKVELQ